MPAEKTPNKVNQFFSSHGEKVGLGIAAALLLGYLIIGVAMKKDFEGTGTLENAITAKDGEMRKEHPERKAPKARNYETDIISWNRVTVDQPAHDFTGTMLPAFNAIAQKPIEIVKLAVKIPAITFGSAEVALDSITVTWSAQEFTRLERRKWVNPRAKKDQRFDIFDITGYTFERMVGESGEWKEMAQLEPTILTYRDTDINPRTLYSYRITSHMDKDKQNRPEAKGMTIGTSAPVRTMGIWNVRFANAMKGMAYVTIEKFDKKLGGKVEIKHIHHAGDKIGWWKEGDAENPVGQHRVSLKGGRTVMVDWNSGMVLKSIEPTKVKVEFPRCRAKFDKTIGVMIEHKPTQESIFISTNEIQYTNEEGKPQKIYSPDPFTNPRAADQRCEEHGGPARRRTTARKTEEGETEEDPAVAKARKREEEAQKIYDEAQKLEGRSASRAIAQYEKLLKEYATTKLVSEKIKNIIEERLVRLRRKK